MLYRIDYQHFLSHMIDYFTAEEILHFQYFVLSAKVSVGSRSKNVAKCNILYPPPELIAYHAESKNQATFEAGYFENLDESATDGETEVTWSGSTIYNTLINPLVNHYDIVIICDENENFIVDAFCKYLKKWHIETIDLNQLFKTGHVGPITIDRKKIWDSAVDLRRAAGNDSVRALESSEGGRYKLLRMMSRKEKISKLKELGIKVNENDTKKHLDELLIESWVKDEDPDE